MKINSKTEVINFDDGFTKLIWAAIIHLVLVGVLCRGKIYKYLIFVNLVSWIPKAIWQ